MDTIKTSKVNITKVGRRYYVTGDLDGHRLAGMNWDSAQQAWYTCKRDRVDEIIRRDAAIAAGNR